MQTGTKKHKKESPLDRWLNREANSPNSIHPRPAGVSVPLSLGQKRLFFLQQLYPENPFYNYADAYRFKGDLKIDRFVEAFRLVVQRHEILRTNFRIDDGQVVQIITNGPPFDVSEQDVRTLSSKEVQNLAVGEARKPFDLDSGPLTRISFLRLARQDLLVVLTMHHIIFDKWSMGLFLREVAENYRNLTDGEDVNSVPLEIQYGDYAHWQGNQTADDEDLSYWKGKLDGSPEVLDLASDFPRPNRPSFKGAYSTNEFPESLSKNLQLLCRDTETTPYVMLLTAYKVLLQRYSGQSDILVGSPVTNRNKIEIEKLIGFFNDTLVLRTDLSDDPTFSELLKQVKKTTREAFSHKNTPFEIIVKAKKPARYLNYSPLFQVMFIYHNVPEMPSFGEAIEFEHEPLDFGVSKFDLTLYISEKNGPEMSATFEYSSDLFEGESIEGMHRHLQNLLERIVQDPDQPISKLLLINEQESVFFSMRNDKKTEILSTKLISDNFAEQVKSNPESTAISIQNENLSYKDLNERANAVANHLLTLDLDRKNPVGLFALPSLEMIIGIFGILKAGFAYLPLDLDYPDERIDHILRDSKVSLVLVHDKAPGKIDNTSVSTEEIGEIAENGNSGEPKLSEAIDPDDLAYVIYTSGSTGKPKGVAVSHRNLAYSTSTRVDFYCDQPESFLLLSSFSFDSSMVGIFWTLSTGGKLVLAEKRIEQDLDALAEIIKAEKITHTLLLPTLYSVLIRNMPPETFMSFKTIIVAGEECSRRLCNEHFSSLPKVKLFNEYGPTEATVWATAHELKPEDSNFRVPIGKPIPNTEIHILDENQKSVPIGVTGEMYISGKGVAKGYFNDLARTESRFVSLQIGNGQRQRFYKTGDLCRYRRDGVIEFLGRKDSQIKLRGFRIELDEIKDTIKRNEVINDVIIKLETKQIASSHNGVSGKTQQLVAYFIAEKNLTKKDFEALLKDKLPGYMIPKRFVQVDVFPRLPNGKMDLNSLLFVAEESSDSETKLAEPKTDLEKTLQEIWEEVLDFKPIGVNDNFFEIGGDSILSIQIISKARKEGVTFAPDQLFEHQTISELALYAKNEVSDSNPETVIGEVPLLPIQHWFFDEHKKKPNHWNQAFVIEIPDAVTADVAEKAIGEIAKYHDSLRLSFNRNSESWISSIGRPAHVSPFARIDLSRLSLNEIVSTIEVRSKEMQSSLSLSESALFQAVFFDCGKKTANKLLLFAHHLLIDHISWQLLFLDLDKTFQQIILGQEVKFSAKTTSYKKWSELLVDAAKSGKFDSEVDFWSKQFISDKVPTVVDAGVPANESDITTIDLDIDSEATENFLKKSHKTYNTKPVELLLSALIQAFEKWSGLKTLCVGLESHGRKSDEIGVDLSNTIGWLTTYFPISLEIDESEDIKSNVISVKEKLRSIPNDGIGFGVLRYLKKIEELNQKPQVIFNYLGNQTSFDFDLLGKIEFLIDGARAENSERHHLIEINAYVKDNKLKIKFGFSEKLIRLDAIENLSRCFQKEFEKTIEHCLTTKEVEYTPSDFPEADLNQDDLDILLNQIS